MTELAAVIMIAISIFVGFLIGLFIHCFVHAVDTELVIRPGGQSELDLKNVDISEGKLLLIRVRYENPIEENTDDESQIKVSP